jgi:hypothetical protein
MAHPCVGELVRIAAIASKRSRFRNTLSHVYTASNTQTGPAMSCKHDGF